MELIYIGENLPATSAPFIKAFQEPEADQQFDWPDVQHLMQAGPVHIRPATRAEMERVNHHAALIHASVAYLAQFLMQERVGSFAQA